MPPLFAEGSQDVGSTLSIVAVSIAMALAFLLAIASVIAGWVFLACYLLRKNKPAGNRS